MLQAMAFFSRLSSSRGSGPQRCAARRALVACVALGLIGLCGAAVSEDGELRASEVVRYPWLGTAATVGLILIILAGLVMPIILIDRIRHFRGVRQTKRDLARLAEKYPWFSWPTVRSRADQAVRKYYDLWATVDLTGAAKYMTPEFFAAQQDQLKRWKKEGKQIVRRLNRLRRLDPLAVAVEDDSSPSWIRVEVTMDRVDYLNDHYTRQTVKGKQELQKGVHEIWWLVYNGKSWVVKSIEDGTSIQNWANWKNRVDTSLLEYKKAKSSGELPVAEGAAPASSAMSK